MNRFEGKIKACCLFNRNRKISWRKTKFGQFKNEVRVFHIKNFWIDLSLKTFILNHYSLNKLFSFVLIKYIRPVRAQNVPVNILQKFINCQINANSKHLMKPNIPCAHKLSLFSMKRKERKIHILINSRCKQVGFQFWDKN